MTSGIDDKVNLNLFGGGLGGFAGGGGGDHAALAVALACRNNDGNNIGNMWPLLFLMNRGDWGGHGHCHDGGDRNPALAALLAGVSQVNAAVPQTGLQTQIAVAAGIANAKDAIQNGVTALAAQSSSQTQSILSAICALGSKIDANVITDLQRQLGVAQAAIADERHERRNRDVEINVTQTVAQAQQQQQFQVQFGDFLRRFDIVCGQLQNIRQAQDIVNLGTMVASGTQASTNTQVH